MPTCASDGFGERVRRVVRARRVAHRRSRRRRPARPHDELLAHRRAVGRRRRRCCSPRPRRSQRFQQRVAERGRCGLGVRAGHEREAVDELAAARPSCCRVRRPSTIACGRQQPSARPAVVAHHHVVALVLARIEVLRRAAVVGTEAAAVVPVGAGEEPPVAAFAEQRVPHAADLRAVDAGAAVGGAADASRSCTPPMLLRRIVYSPRVVRGAVAGLRLHAERDCRARRC